MNAHLFVQSLQGTRAQILFAFLFAGRAMDVDELMTWTGKDRKTHYGHLAALCVTGLLSKQTVAHGRDIYLLGSEMLPALDAWRGQIGSGAPQLNADEVIGRVIEVAPAVEQMSENRTPEEYEALLDALKKHGIVGKKRAELIAAEWVTAEYVLSNVEYAVAEGHGKYAIGIAINRMLDEVVQPARRANGHIENCACDKCTTTETERYSGGMFDEYLGGSNVATLPCVWQEDTGEIITAGPYKGQTKKKPFCKKPSAHGSRYCEEHQAMADQQDEEI